MYLRLIPLAIALVLLITSAAHAKTICTIIADAETEQILLQLDRPRVCSGNGFSHPDDGAGEVNHAKK